MNQPQPMLAEQPSEEFLLRVNDFISMANRLERRLDTAHAYMVFLYAFARYGAHHYLSTTKEDSGAEREAFAQYMSAAVVHLLQQNIAQMKGEAPFAATPAAE